MRRSVCLSGCMYAHSVLDILRCTQLQQQSVVVDTAIERLLNCNLSSKYALTGRLGMSPASCSFVRTF